MTDSDRSHTEEQQNFISQFILSIEQSLNSIIGKYQIIASETSSQEAFVELCNLDDQVAELSSKIEEIHRYEINAESLDRDREKLKNLQEELREIIQELKSLKENVDNLKSLTEDLLLDPQEGDSLVIADVDLKMKSESGQRWTVTVKAGNKNKGNFRNVKIVEGESNTVVSNILLIEPGMTVRVQTEKPLSVGSHISIQSENSTILNQFYIFHLKIEEVISNSSSIILKNLSDEYISNFGVYGEGISDSGIYSIEPFGTLIIKVTLSAYTDRITLFSCESNMTISPYFIINNRAYDDFLNNFLSDLTPEQSDLFKKLMIQNPGADKYQLKQSILNGSIY